MSVSYRKAPKTQNKKSIMSVAEIKALAAPTIIDLCLSGQPFKAIDLLANVPEFATYSKANIIATAIGNHSNGLGLWRNRKGEFEPCADNAGLALALLVEIGVAEDFAKSRGYESVAVLQKTIDALPRATGATN